MLLYNWLTLLKFGCTNITELYVSDDFSSKKIPTAKPIIAAIPILRLFSLRKINIEIRK